MQGDTLDKKFDTFWLNDYQTLRQQNVMPTDVIAFRRRFYNDNRNISKDDRQAIAKVFGEVILMLLLVLGVSFDPFIAGVLVVLCQSLIGIL